MAKITVFTAARMAAIEAASIVAGAINGSGRLILTRNDGGTIDAGAVLGSVPIASSTVAGLVELADATEAVAGTASDRAITPANLASKTASNAEVTAGTLTTKFVTPASLAQRLATTALAGLVRLATEAEAQAGTATDRAVTPAALASLVGTGTGYRFGGTIVNNTLGTTQFTKASYPGLRAINVRLQGSGGAGGGASTAGSGAHSSGAGGGAGGYGEKFYLVSALAASEPMVIGAGGLGATNAGGNDGADSSFGTSGVNQLLVTGGKGGGSQGPQTLYVPTVGGDGGTATGYDIMQTGMPGLPGTGYATLAVGGQGGSSRFGGGGATTYNGASGSSIGGLAGTGWGSGGGGAANNQSSVTNRSGGNATRAIMFIDLYY